MARQTFFTAIMFFASSSIAAAGTTYRITSKDGEKSVEYTVDFGGAKMFERWTGFNPESKTFVYLDFPRGSEPPAPAASIWDHRTGETIKLYKFPGVEQPLPVIPSLKDMKVCPITGDKAFSSKTLKFYD